MVAVVELTGVGLRAAALVERSRLVASGRTFCGEELGNVDGRDLAWRKKTNAAETKKIGTCFARIEGMKCCSSCR